MIIRKILITFSLFALLAGCKKVIETDPTHQLDGSVRFTTIDDYEFALIGAYKLFQQGDYYGAASNAFVGLPDMMSDNMNETTESLGNYTTLTTWRYAEDEDDIEDTWTAAYRIISQANITLRNLDQFASSNPGAVNRIKGQALAIRAMVHFDLLRYYVEEYDRNSSKPGIPYITNFNYEDKPGRGTVKETYDKIEADLNEARTLMGTMDRAINTTASARAFIDVHVVNAIAARKYLYAKDYAKAITYSTLVIDAIPLANRTNFPNVWLDTYTATEVIWSVAFNAGEGRIGDNIYFVPNNRSSYRPNPTLVTLYDQTNDVRFTSYFATRSNRRVLGKYLSKAAAQTRPDGVVNFKAFRTGEMYLIRAEAYARTNQGTLALADLNTLRAARIANFVNGTETGQALLDAIELERRKELIGEGHRWFDLKRTTKTINRLNCTVFCTLLPTDRAWAWPIPLTELNANSNITQNPGY